MRFFLYRFTGGFAAAVIAQVIANRLGTGALGQFLTIAFVVGLVVAFFERLWRH